MRPASVKLRAALPPKLRAKQRARFQNIPERAIAGTERRETIADRQIGGANKGCPTGTTSVASSQAYPRGMADDLTRQLALTHQQIDQRIGMGDQLTTPRPTDHSAEFKKRKSAAAAAEDLGALGYKVTLGKRGLTQIRE